jgi:hypothetical protein
MFFLVITSKVLWLPPWWLGWPLWNICVTNDHGYVPLVVSTSWSFPHSWPITGFVARLTLVEQELFILTEHLNSSPVLSGVRVTGSLVLCVWFVDRCLSFCTFSFDHCVVCSSSIYRLYYLFGIFKLFL